ncbi:unnamed protein product [Allacma fusca]|uniref:Myeloid leukemia factor n=1 Tax=Allacma fusca TaxID=39272 RepID=A0A8J2P7N7_9HEXA|nr:unnamed protein product [Allacma fusca]
MNGGFWDHERAHSRAMSRMMNSFFGDFGGFGAPPAVPQLGMDLMPFGMPMQMARFSPFDQMMNMNNMMTNDMNNGSGAAFQSVSFMSMTSNGADGQPHVYQASSQTRQAGGMKETRKAVSDSRQGVKKMSVGRHIGDRGHVMEREENVFTGQREEHEDLINLEHGEKRHFDQEWRSRAHGGGPSYDRRSITDAAGASGSRGARTHGRNATSTYASGVTIEEVNSDTEETPQPQLALPAIPTQTTTVTSSPTRRHRERRHKASKRSRKMY